MEQENSSLEALRDIETEATRLCAEAKQKKLMMISEAKKEAITTTADEERLITERITNKLSDAKLKIDEMAKEKIKKGKIAVEKDIETAEKRIDATAELLVEMILKEIRGMS